MMKNETKLIARLRVYFFVSRCCCGVEMSNVRKITSHFRRESRRWEMTYFFSVKCRRVFSRVMLTIGSISRAVWWICRIFHCSQTFVIFQLYRKWGQKSNTQKYAKNLPHRHDNSRHSSANQTRRREKFIKHWNLSLVLHSINFSPISTMCKLFSLCIKMKIIYMKLYISTPE